MMESFSTENLLSTAFSTFVFFCKLQVFCKFGNISRQQILYDHHSIYPKSLSVVLVSVVELQRQEKYSVPTWKSSAVTFS